jgi:hypothetical protein
VGEDVFLFSKTTWILSQQNKLFCQTTTHYLFSKNIINISTEIIESKQKLCPNDTEGCHESPPNIKHLSDREASRPTYWRELGCVGGAGAKWMSYVRTAVLVEFE